MSNMYPTTGCDNVRWERVQCESPDCKSYYPVIEGALIQAVLVTVNEVTGEISALPRTEAGKRHLFDRLFYEIMRIASRADLEAKE